MSWLSEFLPSAHDQGASGPNMALDFWVQDIDFGARRCVYLYLLQLVRVILYIIR